MKTFRHFSAALLLTVLLVIPALAGDGHSPGLAGEIHTPGVAGDIDTPAFVDDIDTPALVAFLFDLMI